MTDNKELTQAELKTATKNKLRLTIMEAQLDVAFMQSMVIATQNNQEALKYQEYQAQAQGAVDVLMKKLALLEQA